MQHSSSLPESAFLDFLQPIVKPWYEAIKSSAENQQQLLLKFAREYGKTKYGADHSASEIKNYVDFRANFPKMTNSQLEPYLERVKRGDYSAILSEPPICWVMTRGSTGKSKVLPATKTHLEEIFLCGARAFINYVIRKRDFEMLTGKVLNLNFPSVVATLDVDGQRVTYGYSSGTYAKLNPSLGQVNLLPKQEEIDALGPGIKISDWEKRFELVYQRSLNENMLATMGVVPVILSFARYIKRRHGKKPKDLWKFHALFSTSVRKIHSKYAPLLRSYFGECPVVEIYSATEGVFGQQIDDLPYIVPNYDKYFFEVETGAGTKMLYELKRGEWGKLIISSSLFPRYDIGDVVEAMGKNYFRIIGRAKTWVILEHQLYRLLFRWFL